VRLAPLLLAFALASAPASSARADWAPGRSGEGRGYAYQVFSQDSDEGFVRYQIRGTIEAAPAALVRAVRVIASDPARAPEGQTRRLLSRDERAFVVYTRIDLPPLFSDRDIITRGVSSSDAASGTHRIHWKATEHRSAPPVDGVIRIVRAEGDWVFAPVRGSVTRVTYETHLDLAGSLPGWLIQRLLADTAAETYEDLAREATR
jgi:hypothetical protein